MRKIIVLQMFETIGVKMEIKYIEELNDYYGLLFKQLTSIKQFLTPYEWWYMHKKLRKRYRKSYRALHRQEKSYNPKLLELYVPEPPRRKKTKEVNRTTAKRCGPIQPSEMQSN